MTKPFFENRYGPKAPSPTPPTEKVWGQRSPRVIHDAQHHVSEIIRATGGTHKPKCTRLDVPISSRAGVRESIRILRETADALAALDQRDHIDEFAFIRECRWQLEHQQGRLKYLNDEEEGVLREMLKHDMDQTDSLRLVKR